MALRFWSQSPLSPSDAAFFSFFMIGWTVVSATAAHVLRSLTFTSMTLFSHHLRCFTSFHVYSAHRRPKCCWYFWNCHHWNYLEFFYFSYPCFSVCCQQVGSSKSIQQLWSSILLDSNHWSLCFWIIILCMTREVVEFRRYISRWCTTAMNKVSSYLIHMNCSPLIK